MIVDDLNNPDDELDEIEKEKLKSWWFKECTKICNQSSSKSSIYTSRVSGRDILKLLKEAQNE